MLKENCHSPYLMPGESVKKPPKPRSEEEIIKGWSGNIDSPLVSVVCHTFNHENFIEDSINGFLMQKTTFPFEIIIHDDSSTDATREKIENYQKKYPNIIKTILQKENIYQKGLRPSMFSFPLAKGKYIAVCEGDDFWVDENKIQAQGDFLENNPSYSVCYTDSIPFENNIVIDRNFGGAVCDLTAEELQKGPAIYTLTACFRNVLDSPPELALVRYGDKFIWSRLGKLGKGKFLAGIQPSMYRVHSGGVHSSSSTFEKNMMYFQTYIAMAAYYKRLGDEQLYHYFLGKLKQQVYSSDGVSPRVVSVVTSISNLLRKLKRFVGGKP
jgi:glycosyltransferase involved in cell wall biosynthesis